MMMIIGKIGCTKTATIKAMFDKDGVDYVYYNCEELGKALQKAYLKIAQDENNGQFPLIFDKDNNLIDIEYWKTSLDAEFIANKPIMRVVCRGEKPSYANEFAAGLDLRCNEDVLIKPGEIASIKSMLSIELPPQRVGILVARSGLSFNYQIKLINDIGVIDEDFRGEIGIRLINEGKEEYLIKKGDKVAQMLIIPYEQVQIVYVDKLSDTERGSGGFGHTGR